MAEVGCAGMLVQDIFCGPMKALPCEGLLMAVDSMPTKAGGCAANVAIDVAKQGFAVDVVGCLGEDASAQAILNCFESHRVGCRYVVYTDRYPTSRTVILLVEGEDRRYIHAFGSNQAFTTRQIERDWLAGLKVFYLGGLFAMPAIKTVELMDLLRFSRSKKVVTVVDVVVPQDCSCMNELRLLLPHIDWFVPNEDEARLFTGLNDPLDQLRAFQDAGANTVVITRGKEGAIAARGQDTWRCGTYQMEVVDPSGSGDAFTSGVITSILRGWGMPQTLCYASAIGASAIRAVGTTDSVFTAKEAEAFVASNRLTLTHGN